MSSVVRTAPTPTSRSRVEDFMAAFCIYTVFMLLYCYIERIYWQGSGLWVIDEGREERGMVGLGSGFE